MTFDFASFATGLVAGGLVGVLAGYLHETETIGALQERVRTAMLQFERVSSGMRDKRNEDRVNADLRRELAALQEEIRRLYRKPNR